MAINKKLIKFATQARFDIFLANGDIDKSSVVFIEDTGRLWTQGRYYDPSWGNILNKPTKLSDFTDDMGIGEHIADNVKHITAAERTKWNAAYGWGDFRDYGLGVAPYINYDADSVWGETSMKIGQGNPTNVPSGSYASLITVGFNSNLNTQITTARTGETWVRGMASNNLGWGAWRRVWDDKNLRSDTQNEAYFVDRTTNQTIGGVKSFTSGVLKVLSNAGTYQAVTSRIELGHSGKNDIGLIGYEDTDNEILSIRANGGVSQIRMITNNGERLRIAANGNVGIGTTNPQYKLDVSGTGRFTGTVTAPTFSGTATNTTNINTLADNSSNASRFILFSDAATGNQRAKTDSGLKYNPSSNTITATLAGNASSATNADLLDGHHASETAATGLLHTYRAPNVGETQSWYKLGTLTKPAVTGSGLSKVVAQITGLSSFGSNDHRILILKASTRGSISVTGLMIKGNSANVRVGYVDNGSNIEIWVGYAGAYNTVTNIQILNSANFTVNRDRVNSMPTGFVTGPISISATTDSNVASATKLQTTRAIKIGNTSKNFDGTANLTWTLAEMGVAASSHSHSNYVLKSGDTMTGRLNLTDSVSSRLGRFGTYNSAQTQNIWSIGTAYNVSASTTTLGNLYGLAYSYINVGGSSVTGKHQIHFASNGIANVSINLSDGDITAKRNIIAPTFIGALSGNATSATRLQTARNFTIGNTAKSFNGSANVAWSLAEIGAAASNHTHSDYLHKASARTDTNMNSVITAGMYGSGGSAPNAGYAYSPFIVGRMNDTGWQLQPDRGGGSIKFRGFSSNGSSFTAWKTMSVEGHTHTWTSITGKPTTFAPSAHTHTWTSLTGKPTRMENLGLKGLILTWIITIRLSSGTPSTWGGGIAEAVKLSDPTYINRKNDVLIVDASVTPKNIELYMNMKGADNMEMGFTYTENGPTYACDSMTNGQFYAYLPTSNSANTTNFLHIYERF